MSSTRQLHLGAFHAANEHSHWLLAQTQHE